MITSSTSGLALLVVVTCLASCKFRSDHIIETRHEIKPIEINVNVRVERELDDFFEDLDQASDTVGAADVDLDTESSTTADL